MTRPLASLSLDADNQWSYMKTRGDAGWQSYPSYLGLLADRVLPFLEERDLRITFFVVGQDAARNENREALRRLADAGHEIGNHSFHHEPWLHLYDAARLDDELTRAEDAIEDATGVRPTGFRGPGFSTSADALTALSRRGYRFDASTLPTYLGPLARAYYFMTAHLDDDEREQRSKLFGSVRDGLRPVTPYVWDVGGGLLEIPVTTTPVVKTPFHLSYVLYLSTYSPLLARAYFRGALRSCRVSGVEPSLLVHPLDFLGGDDAPALAFFPAMGMPGELKLERVGTYIDDYMELFDVRSVGEHAEQLLSRTELPRRSLEAA